MDEEVRKPVFYVVSNCRECGVSGIRKISFELHMPCSHKKCEMTVCIGRALELDAQKGLCKDCQGVHA